MTRNMKFSLKTLLFSSAPADSTLVHIAYTLFRFYCGIGMAIGAGLFKVFHKIDEKGGTEWSNLAFGIPDWFVKQVHDIGFTFISPDFWAALAVYGEFIGGLLVAIGLFTRISAIQMSFQFFVVAFIWYEHPMPFEMYYQQWIFWSFVLISAIGGGRYSLDAWISSRTGSVNLPGYKKVVLMGMLAIGSISATFAQTAPRVQFTILNTSLKGKEVEIRHFDATKRSISGYGYHLNALASHAVNMPIGTRIYEVVKGKEELLFVITAEDTGHQFKLTEKRDITREQWLQVAYDEQNEATVRLEKANQQAHELAAAEANGLNLISFRISGKKVIGRKVYVRAQLPSDTARSNVGFSQHLNRSKELSVSYPVGTKIYRCDGPYWNGRIPKETYLFTVDAEKQNYLFRL